MAILAIATSAAAVREVPEGFPRFEVPGLEDEMQSLRRLYHLHYGGGTPKSTLWDEWLSKSSLWAAAGEGERLQRMRRAWAGTLLQRRIDEEGYVSTHQHAGLGHVDGWPFPLWTQGRGRGWHFSLEGIPFGERFGVRLTEPEGWELHGGADHGLEENGWRIELSEPRATLQTPAFEVGIPLHAPYIQIMWKAKGLERANPYIEWTTAEHPHFGPDRRMYFAPAREEQGMVYSMIPIYRMLASPVALVPEDQPAADIQDTLTGMRIHFDNEPSAEVVIKGVMTSYDTRHNVNNSTFIQGSYHYVAWSRDLNFLRNNISRMRTALCYMMNEFQTLERNVIVTPWVGHDGRSGLELGEDGKPRMLRGLGVGNNYWDLLPFGGEDALATIYYYDAVLKMATLEEKIAQNPQWNVPGDFRFPISDFRFDEIDNPADLLRAHAEQVRRRFQERFWNEQTGRFVPAVDLIEGRQMGDYGVTFLNTEAIYYGLASDEQAEQIMQWIDGRRIVEGDTSQGDDIYHWRFGPRSTTKRNIEYYGWYWSGPDTIEFGDQVQDGGAVLGFSYHDLQSRLRVFGPDDAWQRLRKIIAWFDEVQAEGGYREYYAQPDRGSLQGGGTAGGLGMDREFFESILVPQIMIYGFMGLKPRVDGFEINPRLPSDWPELRITRVHLHEKVMNITADRERIRLEVDAPVGSRFNVYLPAGRWSIRHGERGRPPMYQHTEEVKEGEPLLVPVHRDHPIELIRVDMEQALRELEDPLFEASDERAGLLLSRMWEVFGKVDPDATIRFGNEPAWYEWLALKLAWSNLKRDKQALRNKYASWPINEEGYLWSWANQEGWPTHRGRHYENNAKYILGVCRYFFWTGDESFLHQVDMTTSESIFPEQVDVSEGMTALEKARKAMQYQLEDLNGRRGILRIDDPKADGTVTGLPGDYWDNYRFGYLSGYTNVYFYGSLLAMAELEGAFGDQSRRQELLDIAAEVKRNFNELFWDEEKGRYIGCIDVDGNRWDFGFTYVNLEAIFYGLAPPERARRVFEWLDGERIIESDLQEVNGRMTGAVGEDIYAFGFAPRANTRAVESITVDGKYWWWDINGAITVGGVERPSAQYGEHLENGGAIFYVSFYDVMSRLHTLGADAAWERMSGILDEFAYDELRRRPANNVWANWTHGVLGPFPESGLVPLAFLYGFMGIDATSDALQIAPQLPAALEWGQVNDVVYRGTSYRIRAARDKEGFARRIEIRSSEPRRMNLVLRNLQPRARYIVRHGGDEQAKTADDAGQIRLEDVAGALEIVRN